MSLLRIVVGYKSADIREEVPAVLYLGYDGDAANRAGKDAPVEYHRIELLLSRGGQRLRKGVPPSPEAELESAPSAQPVQLTAEVSEEAAASPEADPESLPESSEDDAPSLLPIKKKKP